GSVGTDEIGIAELTDGLGAILLPAGPQIAACKTAENRGAAGMDALALQRQENLFDRVHEIVNRKAEFERKLCRHRVQTQSASCSGSSGTRCTASPVTRAYVRRITATAMPPNSRSRRTSSTPSDAW